MPELNVNASEWTPGAANALTKHLAKIKLTRGVAEKAHAGSQGHSGYNTRSKAAGATSEPQSPTPSCSSDIENALEDELQFEEMFDRVNSGHNSAHSTPRASVS
jgi:hypothetical protein